MRKRGIFVLCATCPTEVVVGDKVRVTGQKETAKTYMSFSGYVGGHKTETFKARKARRPELLVEHAVKGMIPHNRLGRRIFTKLNLRDRAAAVVCAFETGLVSAG